MDVKAKVMERVIVPAGLKFLQWRGEPIARMLLPKYRDDPYPLYREIRERGAVRNPGGISAVARYDAVAAVLRDNTRFGHDVSRLSNRSIGAKPVDDERTAIVPNDDELLLLKDPPDHTRLRRLVGKAFTPRAIEAMEADIERLAQSLVEDAVARGDGAIDVIEDVAFPLPFTVICGMLGVPTDRRADFRAWGGHAAKALDLQMTSGEVDRSRRAIAELCRYLAVLIEQHRREPRDDLLSALIAAEEEGDQLSSRELLATCFLLLVAGFETTVNLIGNGMHALLAHPDEWARLREEPSLVAGAVDELLRFDSPVQMTVRVSYEETELPGGGVIRSGEEVLLLLGGANRDPDVFVDPDRLDIARADASRHLSFSTGVHHCVGAALARMEARAAFRALSRIEGLRAAAAPARSDMMILRGFEHLPVRFSGLAA